MIGSGLRLGNYIQGTMLNEMTIIKVISIEIYGFFICGITKNNLEIKALTEKMQPIQITTDWLLRFGFERRGSTKNYYRHFNFYGTIKTISIEGDVGFSVSVEYETQFAMISMIRYVHELQNIFFAITRNELILDE